MPWRSIPLDIRDQLQRSLGAAYLIERELGGGGMSRVFVANERALDRPVVVKVLAPELAATVSAERFAREIRVAAHLQQANIVPLLTAGELPPERPDDPAIPFYTMPLVDGQSLRRRIAGGGAIPIGTVVHILRDIARALAYAHESGVVHRDIKPENVLLSGETAVVTDFGIARALSESRTLSGAETLTAVGAVVGTPQYMAPEQLAGELAMDHRVDLYAFGCVAYELLAGRPPFHGLSGQRLFAAHMGEAPAPIESLRDDTPAALASLVRCCLAKDPAERPQSARDILAALDHVATPGNPGVSAQPGRRRSRGSPARLWAVAGVAAVAIVASVFALTRSRSGGAADETVQIAVLPFTNVGGDTAQEYFADGMSVSLTDALSRIPGLQLTARSLAFTYKGKAVDVRRVGEELGVSAVLEGTVQRSGSRLRVSSQLTDTRSGLSRWSNTYERQVEDIFAVQDSIAGAIVTELRGRLVNDLPAAARINVAGTANLEAYERYIRGIFLLERRGAGVAQSVDYFNAAIALDSAFAPAWGRLSEALELLPYFSATPAVAVEERAVAAARRALALDSTIAEAHVGLALAYGHAYRWDDAEREFRLALADDSMSAVVRMQYGRHLMHLGQFAAAIPHLRAATRLEPLSGTAYVWLGHNYGLLGQTDSALAILRRAREVDPGLMIMRTITGINLAWAGRPAEARPFVTGLEASPPWIGQASLTLGAIGDTAAARRTLRNLEAMPSGTWMIHTALSYAAIAVGDTSRALGELEAALQAREITPKWLSMADRAFDAVRRSPRFADVVRGFGLDVQVMTSARPARANP